MFTVAGALLTQFMLSRAGAITFKILMMGVVVSVLSNWVLPTVLQGLVFPALPPVFECVAYELDLATCMSIVAAAMGVRFSLDWLQVVLRA